MASDYAEHEARLARCIMDVEKAMLQLKFELFTTKQWIRGVKAKAPGAKTMTMNDLPPEDLEEVFRHCDFITRGRIRRVNLYWKGLLGQRALRENQFMTIDSLYGTGRHMHFMKMVDFTEDKTDTTLTYVKAAANPLKHLTYNAWGRAIRYRHQHIFKLDQCELLRKFLAQCPNLETLVMRNLPGLTWTNLTTTLTTSCPKIGYVQMFNCDQTVDILKTDYTYSPARKRMPVKFMQVSMMGDVAKNFDLASDSLLWPFPEAEKKAHIQWIAKHVPLLTGKAHTWAKEFMRKRLYSRDSTEVVDLRKCNYTLVPRNYWLLDLTSVIMDNPVPGLVKPDPKWLYR